MPHPLGTVQKISFSRLPAVCNRSAKSMRPSNDTAEVWGSRSYGLPFFRCPTTSVQSRDSSCISALPAFRACSLCGFTLASSREEIA